jgi:hypothetical protein
MQNYLATFTVDSLSRNQRIEEKRGEKRYEGGKIGEAEKRKKDEKRSRRIERRRGEGMREKKHRTYAAPHRCDVDEAICKAMKAAAMFTVTLTAKRAMCTPHRIKGYGLIRIRSKRL